LADLYTILEYSGKIEGTKMVFYGDAQSNIANSLILAAKLTGMNLVFAAPEEFKPRADIIGDAKNITWEKDLSNLRSLKNKKVLIIFSSVLHEVGECFAEISKWLLTVKPTVVIRDMMPPTATRPLTKEELKLTAFNKAAYEEVWGKIENPWNLYHYLLKYTYVDNWESEVLENYFSVPWDWFFEHGRVEYRCDYILPYKKEKILEDFGYKLTEPTHRQLITKLK
jgi:hypothetical protein